MEQSPPGAGTPLEQAPPGAGTPRCGPGEPPGQIPLNFPFGVGLETYKACWDTTTLETCCKACWDATCNACWDTTPPVNKMRARCKNITLPQTSFAGGSETISTGDTAISLRSQVPYTKSSLRTTLLAIVGKQV